MSANDLNEHVYELRAMLDLYEKELKEPTETFEFKAAKEHLLTKIVDFRRYVRRVEMGVDRET